MTSHLFISCCTLILVLIPLESIAQPEQGSEFTIAGSVLHFSYQEFKDNGSLFDREKGFIPGLVLGLSNKVDQWIFAGDVAYHGGNVAYTGDTNTGFPITTTTRQDMFMIALRTEYWFSGNCIPDVGLYLGVGYQQWYRDILATTTASGSPVNGLFEIYSWSTGFLGIKTKLYQNAKNTLVFDIRMIQTISPRIEVHFNNANDNAKLNLGERLGYRIGIPWQFAVNSISNFIIEPYFEQYEFGRSATSTLTSNGAAVGTVFEPRSETVNYGLTVGISTFF